MILAIVPENVGFRKVEKGFSPPCFPQNFQLSRVRFYFFLKLSKNWNFARIPLTAAAIMRVAMYEILYMPEIPAAAAINDAVEIAKKYEDEKVVSFINGILGAFVRAEFPEQGRPKATSDPKEA